MEQHLYILTGGSRGMGLAMAEQLLQPEGRKAPEVTPLQVNRIRAESSQ